MPALEYRGDLGICKGEIQEQGLETQRTHWMRLNETFKREVEKRKGAKD